MGKGVGDFPETDYTESGVELRRKNIVIYDLFSD